MGRARFVYFSALTALAVGTAEFLLIGQIKFKSASLWGPNPLTWYNELILPAPVAAAISAYVAIRDPRFQQRTHWAQTLQVCLLAYVLYVPLFAAMTPFMHSATAIPTWGEAIGGARIIAATVFAFSIIPVIVVEYIVIGMARSPGKGE